MRRGARVRPSSGGAAWSRRGGRWARAPARTAAGRGRRGRATGAAPSPGRSGAGRAARPYEQRYPRPVCHAGHPDGDHIEVKINYKIKSSTDKE